MLPTIWRNGEQGIFPLFNNFAERLFNGAHLVSGDTDIAWTPRADMHETESTYIIDIEIPAMNKKDINVTVSDKILTVSGERKEKGKQAKNRHISQECRYGKFRRSFTLPKNVKPEDTSAVYHDGVMTVTVPKTEEPETATYSITVK